MDPITIAKNIIKISEKITQRHTELEELHEAREELIQSLAESENYGQENFTVQP